LLGEILAGLGKRDATLAMRFCRSIVGAAVRLRLGNTDQSVALNTAVQTLIMLGIDVAEAKTIARRELEFLSRRQKHG